MRVLPQPQWLPPPCLQRPAGQRWLGRRLQRGGGSGTPAAATRGPACCSPAVACLVQPSASWGLGLPHTRQQLLAMWRPQQRLLPLLLRHLRGFQQPARAGAQPQRHVPQPAPRHCQAAWVVAPQRRPRHWPLEEACGGAALVPLAHCSWSPLQPAWHATSAMLPVGCPCGVQPERAQSPPPQQRQQRRCAGLGCWLWPPAANEAAQALAAAATRLWLNLRMVRAEANQ